jgi:hypothetical protein
VERNLAYNPLKCVKSGVFCGRALSASLKGVFTATQFSQFWFSC